MSTTFDITLSRFPGRMTNPSSREFPFPAG